MLDYVIEFYESGTKLTQYHGNFKVAKTTLKLVLRKYHSQILQRFHKSIAISRNYNNWIKFSFINSKLVNLKN